jgi:hypothetical protein
MANQKKVRKQKIKESEKKNKKIEEEEGLSGKMLLSICQFVNE